MPALAKRLPTGAAVAMTTPGQTHGLLHPGLATLVLTGWALAHQGRLMLSWFSAARAWGTQPLSRR